MINNRKGQSILLGIVMAMMIFLGGMLFVNHLRSDVTTAEDVTQLDCSNTTISDGAKLTCLGTGATIPYFFVVIIAIAGGLVTARFLR